MSVVLLFSGGIDSTFVLSQLVRQQVAVYPLSFQDQSVFYNTKEKIAVTSILAHYRLSGHEAPMCQRSTVRSRGLRVRAGLQAADVFHGDGLRTALGRRRSAHWILIRQRGFPRRASRHHRAGGPSLQRDLRDVAQDQPSHYNVPKATIIQQAQRNGVPLESTLSCSSDVVLGLMHCGDCGVAFVASRRFLRNVPDPTRYAR